MRSAIARERGIGPIASSNALTSSASMVTPKLLGTFTDPGINDRNNEEGYLDLVNGGQRTTEYREATFGPARFTEREEAILGIARKKWWGARWTDFETQLVPSKEKVADGSRIPRRSVATTKPTLAKDLASLEDRGVLEYVRMWGRHSEGRYVHVVTWAFAALGLVASADSTIEALRDPAAKLSTIPRPGLGAEDSRRWARALRIRKDLRP